ncbi:SMI1/KNR4 family protein [Longispora sp. NPDC051575]|uniref:SMI1/KNR4 family protein n=1 Tax=Longispora sp. NPDC051575 TaxID=3154943 RepID=UPI003436A7E9
MSQSIGWKALLGDTIVAKSALDDADPKHLEPYTLPKVAATEDALAAFETVHGALPSAYRQFLLHANGWPQFYMDADLFGLPELEGSASAAVAAELMDVYTDTGVFDDMDWPPGDALPVGAGEGMRDLFVIGRAGTPVQGQVSWIDGEEIERYPDFGEFIASMRDAVLRRVHQLTQPAS